MDLSYKSFHTHVCTLAGVLLSQKAHNKTPACVKLPVKSQDADGKQLLVRGCTKACIEGVVQPIC